MNEREKFLHEKSKNIRKMSADNAVRNLAIEFARATADYKYSYNFEWMSRPIIQFPQDMIAMQELIWQVKPDLIIKPVAPVFATSQNSILVALIVCVSTYVSVDN